MMFTELTMEEVDALCTTPPGVRRTAERRLLSVMLGRDPEPLESPAESTILTQFALSFNSGNNNQESSTSLLRDASRTQLKVALLKHRDLQAADVHLLVRVDSLEVTLAILQHPACSITTLLLMSYYITTKGSMLASSQHLIAATTGKYGKVAEALHQRDISLDEGNYVTLVAAAASLSDAALETFVTLLDDGESDINQRFGTNIELLFELVDQASLIVE